jgi:2-desacetyl-2-hydroxyethyl bacteriochlorophyllide A dehydrogenase
MKRTALYFTAPRQVELRQEPLPPPGAGQATVAVLASGVSAGTEMLFYRDEVPPELTTDATIAALSSTAGYPLKYGYAAVGRVVDLGAGVEKDWLGRLVFAFQPHQSHFTADVALLHPFLESSRDFQSRQHQNAIGNRGYDEPLPLETAVMLPNMETAVSLLMDGQPMLGERAAVFGQGVVGLLTAALLAQYPLAGLTAVEPNPNRRQLALQMGATAVVDPLAADGLAQLESKLGGPADLCYELSGNPQALNMALGATGFDGRIVIGSWYGRKQAALDLGGAFHRSHIRLIASQVSQINPRWRGRWTHERRLAWAWEMLRRVRPSPLITHRFDFAQAESAYRLLDSAEGTAVGQVVLVYPEEP